MTWPTTKASTTHTDSPTDLISSAREDINQNITNVNLIIDEFDISSPSQGDILVYNSSAGAWQPQFAARTALVKFNDTMQFLLDSAGAGIDDTYQGNIPPSQNNVSYTQNPSQVTVNLYKIAAL